MYLYFGSAKNLYCYMVIPYQLIRHLIFTKPNVKHHVYQCAEIFVDTLASDKIFFILFSGFIFSLNSVAIDDEKYFDGFYFGFVRKNDLVGFETQVFDFYSSKVCILRESKTASRNANSFGYWKIMYSHTDGGFVKFKR